MQIPRSSFHYFLFLFMQEEQVKARHLNTCYVPAGSVLKNVFFFLKDHFFRKSFSCGSVCYHLSKKETKRELFKKCLWLILSVLPPLQLTTLYLGQTHSQKIGWDWKVHVLFMVLRCCLGFTAWIQLPAILLILYEMLDFFISKFLSVERIIFLSDLPGELGWVGDYKKKRKLLWRLTAVVQTYSR